MIELEFHKEPVNGRLLHEQIEAVLGPDKLIGVSTGPDDLLRIHLIDGLTDDIQAIITPVVDQHDGMGLSQQQLQAQDWLNRLAALRKPWDQWTDGDRSEFIRLLAEQMGVVEAGGVAGAVFMQNKN